MRKRGVIDLKGSIGYTGFLDDSGDNHLQSGADLHHAAVYHSRCWNFAAEHNHGRTFSVIIYK